MTDERAVRMAQETAAHTAAFRRYTEAGHTNCTCVLCVALAVHDRRDPTTPRNDAHVGDGVALMGAVR